MPQQLEPIILKPLDHIAMPVQVLLQLVTPADGHVFSLTVDGIVYTFEFDNNSSLTAPGRIAIPLGANDTATATTFVTLARTLMGDKIYFSSEGGYVDMLARHPDTSFAAQAISGTSQLGPVSNSQRSLPTVLIAFNREVFAADVTRGKMVTLIPLDVIAFIFARIQTSFSNASTVNWTGQVTVPSSGRIELINGGATPYVAGNFLQLIVTGDRYE